MNIDIILNKLKNGETRVVFDDEGNAVGQQLHPPTSTMLAAAKIIEQLVKHLNNNQAHINQLYKERNELIDELTQLKKQNEKS